MNSVRYTRLPRHVSYAVHLSYSSSDSFNRRFRYYVGRKHSAYISEDTVPNTPHAALEVLVTAITRQWRSAPAAAPVQQHHSSRECSVCVYVPAIRCTGIVLFLRWTSCRTPPVPLNRSVHIYRYTTRPRCFLGTRTCFTMRQWTTQTLAQRHHFTAPVVDT